MKHESVLRFALPASVAAIAAAALVLPPAAARAGAAGWMLLGWAVATAAGVAGGVLAVRRFGRPGAAFVAAIGGGLALRVLVYGVAAVVAALDDRAALMACLIGLAVGHVAVQAYEMIWFLRRSRAA